MNKVYDTFVDIRNYLMLVENEHFKYCDNEDEQFAYILYLLELDNVAGGHYILLKHQIRETYGIEYVTQAGTNEREPGEDNWFEDTSCHYVIRIGGDTYVIPGLYSSWDGIDIYWDQAYRADPKTLAWLEHV